MTNLVNPDVVPRLSVSSALQYLHFAVHLFLTEFISKSVYAKLITPGLDISTLKVLNISK